jgi:hypothetical protein
MVKSDVLAQIALEDAVPYIIAEIPTNPEKYPTLSILKCFNSRTYGNWYAD